ncbi:MAG: sirohydrochlorin nickelochelatase [Candidatus Methanomethylicaceae archaeon]
MEKKIGVILVGHGSKEPYNKNAIKYFAKKIEGKYPYVGYAFIQIDEPSLEKALVEAVESGVEELIIQPVFLTRGIHVDHDIPKIVGLPAGEKSGNLEFGERKVRIVLSDPIGEDDRIVEILADRIGRALKV